MKYHATMRTKEFRTVAPARERGLKLVRNAQILSMTTVAPARERGLKFVMPIIKISVFPVAPARERGLKLHTITISLQYVTGRSRKGAWIEIANKG